MSAIRIRPHSAIADAALARTTVVELPVSRSAHPPGTPRAILGAIASMRRNAVPERIIVVSLLPVRVRPSR